MSELYFSRDEYAARLDATKKRMAAEGLDVLLVTEPQNIFYLTGYDAYSFYVPQCVLVAQTADLPVWIGRFMDAPSVRRTTYLPEHCIAPYPDTYVQAADRHPMQFVANFIRDKGWGNKVVGVEMGAASR